VSQELVDEQFKASKQFFSLPLEDKLKLRVRPAA
jgi:isopenicillin N synthase-like dioxygenase